jgi:hypothetical protein
MLPSSLGVENGLLFLRIITHFDEVQWRAAAVQSLREAQAAAEQHIGAATAEAAEAAAQAAQLAAQRQAAATAKAHTEELARERARWLTAIPYRALSSSS